MRALNRMEWFRQSCQRVLEQTLIARERDPDEAWRISGSGTLPPQTCAVLRSLWQWRDSEARLADRPAFHILQNSSLLHAAKQIVAGETPEFRHFSSRRRQGFLAAARAGMESPESDWPQRPPRPTRTRIPGFEKKVEELRKRRDHKAQELAVEPAFIAPRNALEGIAADPARSESLLVAWQREVLGL